MSETFFSYTTKRVGLSFKGLCHIMCEIRKKQLHTTEEIVCTSTIYLICDLMSKTK